MNLIAMGFLLAGALPAADAAGARSELAKLQGSWVCIGSEEKGRKFDEKESRREGLVFAIKGNLLTVRRKGRLLAQGTITLNPTKSPAWFDLTYTEDDKFKGKTNHGIYRLKGDELQICVSRKFNPNSTEERPTELKTKAAKKPSDLRGMLLFILKREKK